MARATIRPPGFIEPCLPTLATKVPDGEGAAGPVLFQRICAIGVEGVVSKRIDRPYRSGRSPDWIKVKNPDSPAARRLLEEDWSR